jgi:hypothetical protein
MLAYLEPESEEPTIVPAENGGSSKDDSWNAKEAARRAVDAALGKFTRNLVAGVPKNQERA